MRFEIFHNEPKYMVQTDFFPLASDRMWKEGKMSQIFNENKSIQFIPST